MKKNGWTDGRMEEGSKKERERGNREGKKREKMRKMHVFSNGQNDCLLCLEDLTMTRNYQDLVSTSGSLSTF